MSASATVAVTIAVSPERAFELFTGEIDRWWRRSPAYRFRGKRSGELRFEPGLGGRLVEHYGEGDFHEVGRILAWEPGRLLIIEWRATNYLPGQATEVEVRFRPVPGGTRVIVEHRGWEKLPPDHPALHGQALVEHLRQLGGWWEGLLDGLGRLATHC
ncbi:MAG TPA: SRPBCC domain-containing protein [Aliidongia sp.]|nr:SRPBCC domain-containing protein [Aliidongia sp.]